MRLYLHRFLLLSKRLLKQPGYIFMLALVPIFVLLLRTAGEDGGQLATIGVFAEKDADPVAKALYEELTVNSTVFSFVGYEDEESLIEAVKDDTLVEGWVIPARLSDSLSQFANKGKTDAPVRIIYREGGVSHMLIKEVLNGKIFRYLAPEILRAYISSSENCDMAVEDELSELLYARVPDTRLFVMGFADNTVSSEDDNVILMPVRGILAVWLMICSIAATLFYIKDEENGVFTWWSKKYRFFHAFGYYLSAIVPAMAVYFLGLWMGGLLTNPIREILNLFVYGVAVIILGNIIRINLKTVKTVGIATPVIIMLMTLLSPVFVDFKRAGVFRLLIPSYYYLQSTHAFSFIWGLCVYCVVGVIILFAEDKL